MLAHILPRAAARFGAKPALVTDTRTLSYAELDALSDRVAGALAARGIAAGDRMSLYAQNRWEWIVAYHGIFKAGAVANPINVMLTAKEVRYMLGDCGARHLLRRRQGPGRAGGGARRARRRGRRELARAYVVLRPGAAVTEAELIDFCRPQPAAYKPPRSVRFVPDLPKTSTGKIMRRELRTLD
jgi:acyl-CoA synthetase (AMP-forming)/AMP-acid ligase II